MWDKGQNQTSGDNSNLIQAETVLVQNGISEKRVREIFDEKVPVAIQEFSIEAYDMVTKRIGFFKEDLIPKLVRENLLEALKDPSVQFSLLEAQKSAASSERQSDYSLLSELLLHRIKKGEDRHVRAGVSGAIKIVDEISDEALLGVTLLYSIGYLMPNSICVDDSLRVLNRLFSNVIYNILPRGEDWLEHLDILGALRVSNVSKLRKFEEYYIERFSGYIDVGIEKYSNNYNDALNIIRNSDLPESILCDHELRPGYVRLKLMDIKRLDSIVLRGNVYTELNGKIFPISTTINLSDKQKEAMNRIYALYNSDEKLKKENVLEFFKLWDNFEVLKQVRTWWNDISLGISMTPIGKALAHANAKRCEPDLPEFF